MTTGHPTTFRRLPLRRPHPTLEQTDQGARRPHPKTRHPLMPPLRSDARGIRSRRLQTLPTFPNQTYTDGSCSANRGRQRRHELQLSTLNTNRQVHLCADRRHRRHPAAGRELGSPCERGRFCPNEARFMYCDRSLPPSTSEKKTTSTPDLRRHMTSSPQRFFPSRIFPHDVSRTEREFVRARRRPGLPRDQFSGPWFFSTAEARTSNSSSPILRSP